MALTKGQIELLERFGLPTGFSALSDDDYFAVKDRMEDELQLHGVNDAGDGLNDYGELCRSVIVALPDE